MLESDEEEDSIDGADKPNFEDTMNFEPEPSFRHCIPSGLVKRQP
jgi:hypothetical protein